MKIDASRDSMIITDFDAIDAFRIACKIEKDGIEFYKDLLDKEENIEVRQSLEFLLAEETIHLQLFESRLKELRKTHDEDFEDDGLLECIDFGIFDPYKNIENLAEYLDDIRKSLRLGIKVEDNSISFYKACLDQVSSEEVKEELRKIISEEIKHKDILTKILGT